MKLAQGALLGVPALTVAMIQERVASRYPEAMPLPDRPALDELLRATGLDFCWDETDRDPGAYVSRQREITSVTTGTGPLTRLPTVNPPLSDLPPEITPEVADARLFEQRLKRGLKEGAFLVLLVPPAQYHEACAELCRRFPVRHVDLEGLLLDALIQVAMKARVHWDLVVKTVATPGRGDWDKLLLLVGRALPLVEKELVASDQPLLLTYAGLLARYDRLDLLERLRDQVGRRGGPPALWLLVPNDHQAHLDGKPVPLLSPGQKARIPDAWLRNEHRAGSPGVVVP